MQKIVALSETEAKTIAAVCCEQDMLNSMRILNALGLLVDPPMVLRVENIGAFNISKNGAVMVLTGTWMKYFT